MSRKILVVEDEQQFAEELTALLNGMGYEVFGPADSCSAALELIWRHEPDLAFIDTHLGSETCEAVLEECDRQGIPVVLSLEGQGQPPAFSLGRVQYAKPSTADLVQRAFDETSWSPAA